MKKTSKFAGYTLADCECQYCLHFPGRGKPCPLDTCCCEDEKREALKKQSVHDRTPPARPLRGVAGVTG